MLNLLSNNLIKTTQFYYQLRCTFLEQCDQVPNVHTNLHRSIEKSSTAKKLKYAQPLSHNIFDFISKASLKKNYDINDMTGCLLD